MKERTIVDSQRWCELADRFAALRELDDGARAAALGKLGDDELRKELEQMLAADRGAPLLLEPQALTDAPVTTSEAPPVESVGPYRLLALLGRGGMGEVWLADRDEGGFRRQVALKRVHGLEREELRRRFAVERQALARLAHRGIAQLLDGGVDESGVPYLVLEHVRGESLTVAADRRRLSIDQRLALFVDVCAAVQYAHARLVVHRDLKPSNIFLTESGEVRLLDFGIAKLLDPASTLGETRTAMRLATPAYASPEQLAGEAVTTATDVHGLGLLLHELLTGRRAFAAHEGSAAALAAAVREVESPRPSAVVAQDPEAARIAAARATTGAALARALRGDLDTIVATALRKDPARRYASAERLAADVTAWREGRPIQARPDAVTYRLRKLVGRHRTAVALAAALLLLLASFGGYAWRQSALRAREREALLHRRDQERETSRLMTLAVFYYFRAQPGDLARAEGLLRRVVAGRALRLGSDHPVVANARSHLARVLVAEGRQAEAVPLYRAALAGWAKSLGPEHPLLADGWRDLAAALVATGDLTAGEAAFQRALAIAERARPGDEVAAAPTRVRLAEVLLAEARPDAAEPLLRRAASALVISGADARAETARAQAALGDCLARLHRDAEAREALRAAIGIYEALPQGETATRLGAARAALARLTASAGAR